MGTFQRLQGNRVGPGVACAAGARIAGAGAVLLFVLDAPAWAIPSPDLVIGLFASTAQVLGLATVLLARWAFGGGRPSPAAKSSAKGYRVAFHVTAGLFVLSLVGWGLFYAKQRDLQTQRLQVNLYRTSVENGKLVGDVNLKTLSYSDQVKRKDGFTTEQLATWLATEVPAPMWDVREPEEVEVGAIERTRHVRYPDLLAEPDRYIEKGKTTILLCFNGNRSSEIADTLRPLGYPCMFMIGGYEKWNAEERPLALNGDHERKDLREIPDYPNKDLLLDTPRVHELVRDENAVFVDVRYPGEYEGLGHLPDAINLPFRSLTSPELQKQLTALPKRPIIALCYDKRGSFYGLILGCRLSRLGYDYRGRYTVPEEYYVPGKAKAYVAAWEEAQKGKTLLAMAATPLARCLNAIEERTGDLALAILLLVVLLRFVALPLTWKGERDRRVQNRLVPTLKALKEQHAGDPRAVSRATFRLYREHSVRPIPNLLATCFLIVLFLLFFSVVDTAAKDSERGFLWLEKLSAPDPTLALPIGIGLLVVVQMALYAQKRSLWKAGIWVAVGGGLYYLVAGLNAGVQLYLFTNLSLIVAHTLLLGWWIERGPAFLAARRARKYELSAVVGLRHAHLASGCGNKAARLGQMIQAGLPVPPGFVVRGDAVETWRSSLRWRARDRQAILRAHSRLGARRVAVRSSGLNEDGAEASYAGVFESVLGVGPEGLVDALERVARSLDSLRAQAYANVARERGGIVVQSMVDAEYAGVFFTEHPGQSGAMLVEWVQGLGEDLVSGRAAPQSVRFGRQSGRLLDLSRPPFQLEPLIELGRAVEKLFGKPQDIEWAFAKGRFWLLQARDITRRAGQGDDARCLRERERSRLLALVGERDPRATVLVQSELSELLPRPSTFSLAFMESLWNHGGSTDLACRSLSIPYAVDPDSEPFLVSAFGASYIDPREQARRTSKGPGTLAAFRLARSADELERSFKEEFAPACRREGRLRAALDLGRLDASELVALFSQVRRTFVEGTYVSAERINIAADFYFKAAVRRLEKRGLDPSEQLSDMPPTIVHEAMLLLGELGEDGSGLQGFLELFGHRAPLDYEFAQARYVEDPGRALQMAARSAPARSRKPAPVRDRPAISNKVLALQVDRARRFASLKEDAKHEALRELAFLRSILLELSARFQLGQGIFELTPDEVERLGEVAFVESARERIRERQRIAEALESVRLPSQLTTALLEDLDTESESQAVVPQGRCSLSGLRVAGSGDVRGRVRILREASEIDSFQPGDILVARFTDPTWMPVFPLASGLITEIGGWLSHAAIQAREYGITAIVGAGGALDTLRTGDLVRLNADGTIEIFSDRRSEERHTVELEILLRHGELEQEGRLIDLSEHGALLLLSEGRLELGEQIELSNERPRNGWDLCRRATVVRNGTPKNYGLRFEAAARPGGNGAGR
jgi:rifampicin phosphotransferase